MNGESEDVASSSIGLCCSILNPVDLNYKFHPSRWAKETAYLVHFIEPFPRICYFVGDMFELQEDVEIQYDSL